MTEQSQPPNKLRNFLAIIAIIADIAAVVSLGFSLPVQVVLVAASLSILLGIFAFVRGWNKSVKWAVGVFASFGLGTLVLGWTLSSMMQVSVPTHVGMTPTSASSVTPTPNTPGNTSAAEVKTPVSASAQPQAGSAKQIRIKAQEGVDVEVSPPKVEETDGPNDDLDLYMDGSGYILSNEGNIFNDEVSAPEKDAYTRCKKMIDAGKDANKQLPFVGRQFCFRTSTGKVGWARVNAADIASKQSFAVLNIQYW